MYRKNFPRRIWAGALMALVVAAARAETGTAEDTGGNTLVKRRLEEAWMWGSRGEIARAESSLDQAEATVAGGTIDLRYIVSAKLMRAKFAEKRGKFDEAREFLNAAEASLTADTPDELRFLVLEEKMAWLHVHGELRGASLVADEMLTLAELRRDQKRISHYSGEGGMLLFKLGALNGAEARASRALEVAAEANLQVEMGKAKKLQGAIANKRGKLDGALGLYQEALVLFSDEGDYHQIANCHYHIATVAYAKKDLATMRMHIDEAVAVFTQAGALRGVGLCLILDGQAYLVTGNLLKASERLEEAERIFVREQDRHNLGATKQLLAGLASLRREEAKATELMQEASRLLGPGAN